MTASSWGWLDPVLSPDEGHLLILAFARPFGYGQTLGIRGLSPHWDGAALMTGPP